MKKVFVCMYLAKNLGDDLFLDTLLKRYPNCNFTINYISNDYDKFISNYENLDRCYGRRDFNKISIEYDALIYMGGSLFQEVEGSKNIYANRTVIMQQFSKRNKPVFILGSNFGPYTTEEFYHKYEELFKKIHDMCFRDEYSYNLFKHLNQVRYAYDIAFNSHYLQSENKAKHDSKIVGFSIINLSKRKDINIYEHEYVESIIKSIKIFIDKGYKCCLMSFCEMEKDIDVINEIINNLGDTYLESVLVYEYKDNLNEAINLISTFNLFVATRLHANIIAISLDIPILPIIYNMKIKTLLSDFRLDDLVINLDELNLLYDEDIIDRSFNNKLSSHIQLINNQFEKLDIFLK